MTTQPEYGQENNSEGPVEVSGGFADLGLENPGSYELPSSGIPVGTHQGFIKQARFVAKKDDKTKKNLHLVYEVREAGNPATGKTAQEFKPCNPDDSAKAKGFLVARLNDLGVSTEEIPTFNVKTLVGMPVYIKMWQPPNNRFTNIDRITKNTDGEFVSVPEGPAETHTPSAAVSAGSLDY